MADKDTEKPKIKPTFTNAPIFCADDYLYATGPEADCAILGSDQLSACAIAELRLHGFGVLPSEARAIYDQVEAESGEEADEHFAIQAFEEAREIGNAQRVVTTWNKLLGISSEALEQGIIEQMKNALDANARALRFYITAIETRSPGFEKVHSLSHSSADHINALGGARESLARAERVLRILANEPAQFTVGDIVRVRDREGEWSQRAFRVMEIPEAAYFTKGEHIYKLDNGQAVEETRLMPFVDDTPKPKQEALDV